MARPKTAKPEDQEPEVSEENTTNKDGLIPGQMVDWETLQRIESARREQNA